MKNAKIYCRVHRDANVCAAATSRTHVETNQKTITCNEKNMHSIYFSVLYMCSTSCIVGTVHTASKMLQVNRNIIKFDKIVFDRCLVDPMLQYLRLLFFININIFPSFEAGNCVSNSSFK